MARTARPHENETKAEDRAGRRPSSRPTTLEKTQEADLLTDLLDEEGRKLSRRTAGRLLREFGDLAGLASADEAALERAGLGSRAVSRLTGARMLAVAMLAADARRRPVLSSWTALLAYLRADLAHAPREQFRVLFLDKRNLLIREEHRAEGTIDHAPVFNAGPALVEGLGRVPRIPETEAYVELVLSCYLALAAGRDVRSARDCRSRESGR